MSSWIDTLEEQVRNEKEKFMLASRGSGSEVVSKLTASTAVAAEAAANAAKVRHFSEMCGWRKICLLSFVSCLSVSLSVARARNAEEMCRQPFTHILTRMRGSPILVYVVARMLYVCCIDHRSHIHDHVHTECRRRCIGRREINGELPCSITNKQITHVSRFHVFLYVV